jgi:hypothetical protein
MTRKSWELNTCSAYMYLLMSDSNPSRSDHRTHLCVSSDYQKKIPLNRIKRSIFVVETKFVLCDVGADILYGRIEIRVSF